MKLDKTNFNLPDIDTLISKFSNNKIIYFSLDTVKKYNMIHVGDRILISISGGPDSVFLIYFFDLIKDIYNLKLFAFHLDHLTREGQSTKDALFVKDLCEKLAIPLFSECVDVKKWCAQQKLNFQEGARILRMQLLEKYSLKNDIDKIAIAHNADDNIETFFINLLRGAGLRGLGAIKPVSGKIIRPLLFIFKKDINDFLISNNINFCIDKTNFESKYFRNKIRNKIIPVIENEIGSNFKNNILKTIENFRYANDYFDKKAIEIIKKFIKKDTSFASFKNKSGYNFQYIIENLQNNGFIKFPISIIQNLDEFLKSALIFKLVEIVKGNLRDINLKNINDILNFCYSGGEHKRLSLNDGIIFVKDKEFIYFFDSKKHKNIDQDISQNIDQNIYQNKKTTDNKNYEDYVYLNQDFKLIEKLVSSSQRQQQNLLKNKYVILISESEKEFFLQHQYLTVTCEESFKSENEKNILVINDINKVITEFNIKVNIKLIKLINFNKNIFANAQSNEAYFDFDLIKFPIIIRNWQEGDSFIPLGLSGKKKLQDFFIDLKIPFYLRKNTLIFCDAQKIIWVGNLRIDDRVKVTDKTKVILKLKLL